MSRSSLDNRPAYAKQIARSGKRGNKKAQQREARIAQMTSVIVVKLSGLDIMRIRKAAASYTLPTKRRILMYYRWIDLQKKKQTKRKVHRTK